MERILIVEDDQIVGNIYRNRLSLEGYQVEIARDGLAGLEMVHSFRPDAVILDLMLPRMTGVELMKRIRSEPGLQQLPVIVFSNTYLTNMVQEAWKAGATKCLSKSSSTPMQVIEVLRGALSAKGASASTLPPGENGRVASHKHPAPHRPAHHSEPVPGHDAEAEFQAELRHSFIAGLPASLAALRTLLKGLVKTDDEPGRLKQVYELYRCMHSLAANAGAADVPSIARMSDALEALLKELYEKPETITASTLRTAASGVDFLGLLIDRGMLLDNLETPPPKVLVVDDDAISRRAVTYALEQAKLKSTSVEDPAVAYELLAENRFDLVFLDVDMPGMNGFQLCSKIRQLPAHRKTPIVFVTGLNSFESRANSSKSGGTDLIAKPFLFIELAVKALVCLLRVRLQPAN
jgi:CheY-like chemotaxis protein